MKTLKKHKFLQLLLGFAFAFILLFGFYALSEMITFPENGFWNIAQPVILVFYMLVFMASLTLLGILSRHLNFPVLYHSSFGVCFTSVLCAIVSRCFEDSFYLLVLPLTTIFGTPVRLFTQAIEQATTYTEHYTEYGYDEVYSYEQTILYEDYVLIILFVLTLVSVVVYQLYTTTDEQIIKKSRWHLEPPARTAALVIAGTCGSYIILCSICYLLYDFIVFEILWGIMSIISVALFFTGAVAYVPICSIIYMLGSAIKQAHKTKNPRQVFNPLIILAIILSVIGYVVVYNMVLSGF